MSSTWVRTRCICWWWTRTPARARCPPIRTRRSCGWPNSSTRTGRSAPRASTGWSRSSRRRCRPPRTRASRTCCRSRPPRCARPPTPTTCWPGCGAETGVELAGPHRRGGGPAHLPRRPPLVRLVGREAAGPGHRRRLAGDRVRHRRGAGRGGVAAAGRGPADRGLAARRPAGPGGRQGAAPPCARRDRPYGRRVQPLRRARPRGRHVQDLQAAGPHRRRRPLRRGPVRPARADAASRWRSGCRGWPP